MLSAIGVANSLDGIFNAAYLGSVFEHTLGYVEREAKKVIRKIIFIYLMLSQFKRSR